MTVVDTLFDLWQDPIEGPEAYAAFAEVYCDPVIVNGNEMALADLVVRARTLQGALAGWVHQHGGWPWLVALGAAVMAAVVLTWVRRALVKSSQPDTSEAP